MNTGSANSEGRTSSEGTMIIRARQPGDIDACIALLADVHAADRYPLQWPANPPAWLTSKDLLGAWVVDHESRLVGHVSLCSAASESSASLWSSACDVPPEQLAVIARLFAAPSARGRGVGAALLDVACDEARSRGLRPVLDVLDLNQRAMALYERKGWRRIASVPASWAVIDSKEHLLHYFISPD